MGKGHAVGRITLPAGPVSVQLDDEDKREIAAEAKRRGLKLSPTVRTLAKERLAEIREERQLSRARQWQTDRMMQIADRVEAGDTSRATQTDIDRTLEEARASAGEGTRARRR